ncbi:MAG: hypothetical protein ACYCSS_01825 [Sulfuriferula sp.]
MFEQTFKNIVDKDLRKMAIDNLFSYLRDFRQKAIVGKLEELMIGDNRLQSIYQQELAAFDELKKSIFYQALSGGALGRPI